MTPRMCVSCQMLHDGLAHTRISASALLVILHRSGNPALNADKYAGCRVSGSCLLYTSPSPRD
eukprot:14289542-Alexandrium_andersonii.AAC.1